ncbi:hypothetical protein TNCV_3791421 [Trichonephila clavipes]|nr:hypothetical protein TNCV_3791421 [Trichonephila clavipes]
MHLPTSKLGSVIKAGSCFNSTIVPAASSVLQSPSSYSSQLQQKKKKIRSFSIPIASWCSSNAFLGLLSPPSLRSSTPARVTEVIWNILDRWAVMPIYSIKEVSGDFTDSLSNSGDFKVSSKINISHIPMGIENLSNNYILRAFK